MSLGDDATANFGDTVLFALNLSNQGTAAASGITLFDEPGCGISPLDESGQLLPANVARGWVTHPTVPGTYQNEFQTIVSPGGSVRTSIFLRVKSNAEQAADCNGGDPVFQNYAEIESARGPDGTLLTSDFDSNYDILDRAEDGGAVVNGNSDNVVTGDGTGTNGDDDPATDDDDSDAAGLDIIDVALRKTVDDNFGTAPYRYGETVKFDISLISQGNVPVDEFEVVDYLPRGLTLNTALSDPAWMFDAATRLVSRTGITAADITGGDSVVVSLYADITPPFLADEDFTNTAEISRFSVAPRPGQGGIAPGFRTQDADSSQDAERNNDPTGIDLAGGVNNNNIFGGGLAAGQDEDDSDQALPLIVRPVVVGDTVFIDVDNSGAQSAGDLPIEGVSVSLFNADGTPVDTNLLGATIDNTVLTDERGRYLFDGLAPGSYFASFDLATAVGVNPDLFEFVAAGIGPDDLDSDVDPANGVTPPTPELLSGDTLLTLDAGVACNIAVNAGEPTQICSVNPVVLPALGASLTPISLGGQWSTDGDGMFDGTGSFATTTQYLVGQGDASRGFVNLTLTTNPPSFASGCQPASSTVTIVISKVDCGTFFWDGE